VKTRRGNLKILFGLGVAAGVTAARLCSARSYDFRGRTVFITGGSRGLGLLMAREFALRGAKVAIAARDTQTLARAEAELRKVTDQVLAIDSDITVREDAETAVDRIRQSFGPVDVLVNNAGTISVGPFEVMTIDDYRDSIETHFWGPYFATMAVLPGMRRRRQGRIVNISSIGGKISVPHLLPYSVGKFALTGFSEGLRAALLKEHIFVTTVCPGLMRTGSPRNAFFKGDNEAEYAWFSVSDAMPVLSMSAERAARQIVNACSRGDAELILTAPAKAAVRFAGVFPGITSDLLAIANEVLPSDRGAGTEAKAGKESFSSASPSWATTLNERVAKQNNQVA